MICPPPPRQHPLQRELRAENDTQDVDLDLSTGDLVRLLVDMPGRHHPRVVDKHIDGTERVLGRVEESADRLRVRHVESDRNLDAEVLGRGLELDLVDVADRHLVAASDQLLRGVEADPSGAAGDGNHP